MNIYVMAYLALRFIGLGITATKHGQEKPRDTYNVLTPIIDIMIMALIFYLAGWL